MKCALIAITILFQIVARASLFPVTNETDFTFNATSWDTEPYILWGAYFKSYFDNMYPAYTNHIMSWSRSGSSLLNDWQAQQQKYCAPWWNSYPVPGSDFFTVNENGGPTSNDIVNWSTNIYNAPALMWDGTSITNEGFSFQPISHYCINGFNDDAYSNPTANLAIALAGSFVSNLEGSPVIDTWGSTSNGLANDSGQLFGYYSGGHPFPVGHLSLCLVTLLELPGVETNIGAMIVDSANGNTLATNIVTSRPVVASTYVALSFSCLRLPLGWDVPDGTITNDARGCFTVFPSLGNAFNWTFSVKNLSAGNYTAYVDGVPVDTASAAQWSSGRNWFTNYVGPLWWQRIKVLADGRDFYGVDHVTLLNTHDAGSPGVLGVGDLINYQSNAAQQYDSLNKRGPTYVTAMATHVSNCRIYDTQTHNDAQPKTHSFVLVPSSFQPSGGFGK